MANQTNVHKKMDKILQKLETLEDNDKAIAKQTNYLAQLVVLAKQDSARQHQESLAMMVGISQTLKEVSQTTKEVSQTTKDVALMTAESLRLGRETAERVAEILGKNRTH